MPLRKVDVPEGSSGDWTVVRKVASEADSCMSFLVGGMGRGVPPGEYTLLKRSGAIVMSDTPDEMRDHYEPVRRATGRCLIAGLGLGVVLQAVLDKPDVAHVTVVERSADVIKLVAGHYLNRYGAARLEVVEADIFEWSPPPGTRYDMAWFDIWNDICADNLAEMATLNRRFARRAAWKGCWAQHLCRRQRAAWSRTLGSWRS